MLKFKHHRRPDRKKARHIPAATNPDTVAWREKDKSELNFVEFCSSTDIFIVVMKSQGEIEAAICDGISRFEQDYMGRGPKDIHAHRIGDLLVIRLRGVLTAAEQHLVTSLPAEKGRDLLKQVRTHLIETARPIMETMVQEVTGVKVVSLHHDISTTTGEEVVLYTLAESPLCRETRKK